jgi:hypothetical protein
MAQTGSNEEAWRNAATKALVIIGGVAGCFLATVMTGGVILAPILYLVAIAPILLLSYLWWGRSLTREVAAERVLAEVQDKIANLEVEQDSLSGIPRGSNQGEESITPGIESATGIVPGQDSGA